MVLKVNIMLTRKCNLSCSYCCVGRSQDTGKLCSLTADELLFKLKFIAETTKRNLELHIMGGEPFVWEHFIDFCNKSPYKIVIHSNLTCNVKGLTNRCIVKGSYHFEALDNNQKLRDKFFDNANYLSKFHKVVIFYLALPDKLSQMPETIALWQKILPNACICAKPYKSGVAKNDYPQKYTEFEKALIKKFANGFEPEMTHRFMEEGSMIKGLNCTAGLNQIRIEEDGLIYQCVGRRGKVLGDIFENTIKLEKVGYCPHDSCPCSYHGFKLEEKQ